jgi:hypothetical protein
MFLALLIISKNEDNSNINTMMKYFKLFKDYYNKLLNKSNNANYPGIEYVAYDKEYDDKALDNDEYDKKNDAIDLIEKHLMLILMYIHIPAVAERLIRACPAPLGRAGVGLIPANPNAQNVPSFRRWRFEMKLSLFFIYTG